MSTKLFILTSIQTHCFLWTFCLVGEIQGELLIFFARKREGKILHPSINWDQEKKENVFKNEWMPVRNILHVIMVRPLSCGHSIGRSHHVFNAKSENHQLTTIVWMIPISVSFWMAICIFKVKGSVYLAQFVLHQLTIKKRCHCNW